MIKYIRLLAIIGCSFCVTITVQAQDYKADLIKVYEKLNNSSFKMEMEMKMSHWNTSTPVETVRGTIKRKGINYYTNFSGRITLQNKWYHIIITKRDKHIIYMPVKNTQHDKNQEDPMSMMNDTNMFKNVKLIKSDATGKTYEMLQPGSGMKKARIKISHNNALKEVRYYYEKTEENPVKEVVITYSNVVFNPVFTSHEFSEKKYFKKVDGKEVLTSAYKEYTLSSTANYGR